MSGGLWLRAVAVGWVLVLSACATIRPPTTAPASTDPLADWAAVLNTHVDTAGRIDFRGLVGGAPLQRFVAWLAGHGPASDPESYPTPDAVLAYHLNAYNALAMYKVLQAGIPETLAGWRKVRFFALDRVVVDGATRSLYDYENNVIRPLGEPRAHFALNCMVVGCPRLPRTPFEAADLDEQLENAAIEFFNTPRHLRIDPILRTVFVSEILDFYPQDFLAAAPTLTDYINRYRAPPLAAEYRIEFIAYDWTINRRR